MPKKAMLETLSAAFFLAIATALFFPELIWGGKVLFPAMGDAHLCEYSWGAFSGAMAEQGLFPMWNPLVLCGRPFGADIYSGLSIYLLACARIGDLNFVWNFMIFLNVFLAGLFTFLYMRRLGIHPAGGMLTAMVVAFSPSSGANWLSQVESHIFYLPLILWITECIFAERKARYIVFLFLSTTLLFLNAVPQHSLYFGIFFILYVFFRFRSFLGIWIVLFAVGANSFYLFRLFEYLGLSSRSKMHIIVSLFPTHLFNLVFPYLYEAPFRQETNFFFSKIFGEISRRLFHAGNVACYAPPYIGILGLTFAWFSRGGRGPVRFYWSVIAFLLFYMMTYPIFAGFYAGIPILSQLYRIDRLSGVFTFVLAVLAGIGFDRYIVQKQSLRGVATFYVIMVTVVVGTLGLARAIVSFYPETIRGILAAYIKNNVVDSIQYKAPLDFYLKRIDEFFRFILRWTDLSSPSVIVPVVFIIFSLVVLFLWQRGSIGRRFFFSSCAVLLFLDFFVCYRLSQQHIGARPEAIVSNSGLIRFLQVDAKKEAFRVATILEKADYGAARTRDILHPDLNMIYGLGSIEGYAPLLPRTYVTFVKSFQTDSDKDPDMLLLGQEGSFDYAMADFLNVKYFVTKKEQKIERPLPVVYEDSQNKLFLNTGYYPRVFLVRDYEVQKDKSEILAGLKQRKNDLRRTVFLEEQPKWGVPETTRRVLDDEAIIEEYQPDFIRIKVSSVADNILVLSDNYFPGWKARLDGLSVAIYKANFSFRAVMVPSGNHELTFSYEPVSFRYGVFVSIFWVVSGGCILMIFVFRRHIPI